MENTNLMLKQLLSTMVKGGTVNKSKKDNFVRFLKVDVENYHPINFTDETYRKSVNENDLFLFISRGNKLIGILKGNEYRSYYKKFVDNSFYDMKNNNRKNYKLMAYRILMIPDKDRTFTIKKDKYEEEKQPSIQKRLVQYKKNKRIVSNEKAYEYAKNSIKVFSNFLSSSKEDQKEIIRKIREFNNKKYVIVSGSVKTMSEVLKSITTDVAYLEMAEECYDHYKKIYESDPENEKIKNVLNNSKDTLDKLKITFVKMNDFVKTL